MKCKIFRILIDGPTYLIEFGPITTVWVRFWPISFNLFHVPVLIKSKPVLIKMNCLAILLTVE